MELPEEVVELVLETLDRTVNSILTSDEEMQALMDQQELALERLSEAVTGSQGATGR